MKKTTKRRKVVAGVAALGLGLGAYGVYATSLNVTGSAGTALQAGTDTNVSTTSSCDSDGMAVVENYSASTLSESDGYSIPERTGYTVSDIAAGCSGKTISLAVKKYGSGVEAEQVFAQIGADGQVYGGSGDLTFSQSGAGTGADAVVAYSIRVS